MAPNIPSAAVSYVVIPDTQFYTELDNGIFASMTDWIVNNQDTYNIEAVIHVGDIIENYDGATSEWDIAESAINTLDSADIPTIIAAASHDAVDGDPRSLPTFRDRFPTSRYADMESNIESVVDYGTFEGKPENVYVKQDIGGVSLLFIAIEFAPRDAVMDWVVDVCADNPDSDVILDTHILLNYDGERLSDSNRFAPSKYNLSDFNNGVEMWDGWLSQIDNLRMTHNGHQVGGMVAQSYDFTSDGYGVLQQFQNYQIIDNGGDGTMRLVTINPDTAFAEINTYSTVNDAWSQDEDEKFTTPFGRKRTRTAQSGQDVRVVTPDRF